MNSAEPPWGICSAVLLQDPAGMSQAARSARRAPAGGRRASRRRSRAGPMDGQRDRRGVRRVRCHAAAPLDPHSRIRPRITSGLPRRVPGIEGDGLADRSLMQVPGRDILRWLPARRLPQASSSGASRGTGRGTDRLETLGFLSAAVALSCGIGAGSGPTARERASCKRQVSGSNPLTGSTFPNDHPDFAPSACQIGPTSWPSWTLPTRPEQPSPPHRPGRAVACQTSADKSARRARYRAPSGP